MLALIFSYAVVIALGGIGILLVIGFVDELFKKQRADIMAGCFLFAVFFFMLAAMFAHWFGV